VVFSNLNKVFPEKTKKGIKIIAKKSYLNLTDILLESLKGLSMPEDKLIIRYRIIKPELLSKYCYKDQSVIGVSGHYCNWKWGALAGSLEVRHKLIAFYKPLSNKHIDAFLKKSRAESGTLLKSIYKTSDGRKPECNS
jgi:KDO2-lipid IV(A) lauroyltransferase